MTEFPKYTEPIFKMLEEANTIKFNEPGKALEICNKAYLNALKSGDEKAELGSLYLMGVCNELISNYPEAMKYLTESIKLSTMLGDKKKIADSLNTIGIIHDNLGNYSNALKTYFKALKMYEEIKEISSKAIILSNIGLVYTNIRDYTNAIKFYSDANGLAESLKDTESLLVTYINIGLTHRLLGDYDKAKEHLLKGLNLAKKANDKLRGSLALTELGDVEASLGNNKQAYTYYNEALDIKYELNDKKGIALVLTFIGVLQLNDGDIESAKHNIMLGLGISEEIGVTKSIYELHELLSQVYEKEENPEMAFYHFKISHVKQLEYLSEESEVKTKNLAIQNEVENAQREAEIQRLRNVELAKALEEVNMLNRNLKDLNEEKNEFMGVAVHDLKNPLQNILSTARVLNREKSPTPELISSFTSNIIYQTDRMFNLIKKLLDHNAIEQGNIKTRKTIFEIKEFCSQLINDFRDATTKKDIQIQFEDNTNNPALYTDKEILYEILQNLISNAIKFSPAGKNICFKANENESEVVFDVTDEGPGFTDKDKEKIFTKFARLSARPTDNEHSTGLGLSIVKKLTEILGASLKYHSDAGQGTTFTLKVQKPDLN